MINTYLIVTIESYVGSDTFLYCGLLNQNGESEEKPIFCVVNTLTGVIVDSGYRTFEEAEEAWPNVVNANRKDGL